MFIYHVIKINGFIRVIWKIKILKFVVRFIIKRDNNILLYSLINYYR